MGHQVPSPINLLLVCILTSLPHLVNVSFDQLGGHTLQYIQIDTLHNCLPALYGFPEHIKNTLGQNYGPL